MVRAIFLGLLVFAGPAWADYSGPAHDPAAIVQFLDYRGPVRNATVLSFWRKNFLGQPGNRAIAVSPTGAVGTGFGWPTVDEAKARALSECAAHSEEACALYAINMAVVYPGAEAALPALDVRLGDLVLRGAFVFRGPARAKGLVVWSHGYGGTDVDERTGPPPGVVSRFNLAGWDVLRFDRDPWDDGDVPMVETRLADSLDVARAAGYRSIILAGQSRGAWQSLDLMGSGRSLDRIVGVLAFSPAKNGKTGTAPMLVQPDEWRHMLGRMAPGAYRVTVAFFGHDDYNPAADDEAATARRILAARGIDSLVLLENDPEILKIGTGALSGHGGANRTKFTAVYGDCLVRFVEAGERGGGCR